MYWSYGENSDIIKNDSDLTKDLKDVFNKFSDAYKKAWEGKDSNKKVIETSKEIIAKYDYLKVKSEFLNTKDVEKAINDFRSNCASIPGTNEQLNKCRNLNNSLSQLVSKESNDLVVKLDFYTTEIKNLMNTAPTLEFLEKLKNYETNKFLRQCSNQPNNPPMSIVCNKNISQTISTTAEQLSNQLNEIIPTLIKSFHYGQENTTRGEFGVFPKKNLAITTIIAKTIHRALALIPIQQINLLFVKIFAMRFLLSIQK